MDSLSLSTLLSLVVVAVGSFLAQARATNRLRRLLLCCALGPLVALCAEPIFYSPVGFVTRVLPRLPGFVLQCLEVYPAVFLKVAWIPMVCGIASWRRDPIRLELS